MCSSLTLILLLDVARSAVDKNGFDITVFIHVLFTSVREPKCQIFSLLNLDKAVFVVELYLPVVKFVDFDACFWEADFCDGVFGEVVNRGFVREGLFYISVLELYNHVLIWEDLES